MSHMQLRYATLLCATVRCDAMRRSTLRCVGGPTEGPQVNVRGVVGGAQHELRGPVKPGAYVRDAALASQQILGAPKVAQLQRVRVGLNQQVLGLQIPVANILGVQIR